MKDMAIDIDASLEGLDPDAWLARLEEIGEDLGYYEDLGNGHASCFIDAGPRLLVTFENAETIRESHPRAEPRGFAFVRKEGWSHLMILSDGTSWFREPRIWHYIDRLIDDGFFEDFDKVLFFGIHAAGYAATAYSVAAPGATVLAIRPQATLDPRIAGFDSRYTAQRRLDFTTRYGYAPDMVDAANDVYVAFDPLQLWDSMHASLFTKSNVTALRCNGFGARMDRGLDALGLTYAFIKAAMNGTLDTVNFAILMRGRRGYAPYLRWLYTQMIRREHPRLAAAVCVHVLRKTDDPFFVQRLDELIAQGHYSPDITSEAAE